MTVRKLKLLGLALFSVFIALAIGSPDSVSGSVSRSGFKRLLDARARLATRETKTYRLPSMSADKICSLLVSTPSPVTFGSNDTLQVTLRGGGKTIAGKSLHAGDPDLYTLFRSNGEAKSYERGVDPVTPPHEVQALAGNKFTTRILARGTYYVRVDANHVFYQLRTAVYDAPPFSNQNSGQKDAARKAVRAGMDYLVSAGDSWHANTPRHGGVVSRISSAHFETQLCVACHATHFTTRGELTAKQNGYAVNKRSSLQFLTERLANNPLPFYGHKDAYWTRVISAPANVMSRLA